VDASRASAGELAAQLPFPNLLTLQLRCEAFDILDELAFGGRVEWLRHEMECHVVPRALLREQSEVHRIARETVGRIRDERLKSAIFEVSAVAGQLRAVPQLRATVYLTGDAAHSVTNELGMGHARGLLAVE
jgi:hypothetical protein